MGLKELLKIAGVGACIYGGVSGIMIGATKIYNECQDMRYINEHGIYATETVGIRDKVILDWDEGSGVWLHYKSPADPDKNISIFADTPLGEGIKVIWTSEGCVKVVEPGFQEKPEESEQKIFSPCIYLSKDDPGFQQRHEEAKKDWARFCEEIECKELVDEWEKKTGRKIKLHSRQQQDLH